MAFEDRYRQEREADIECLLFDLDDTLYPLSSGIADGMVKNIADYLLERLGIEKSKIDDLSNLSYKNYGTTLAGLKAMGYRIDYDDYHSFVHGRLPYESLKPDLVLRNLLLSLPIRKLIFTNGDRIHAVQVLSRLGLEDCFEGIICFETLNPPKDEPATEPNFFDIIKYSSQPIDGVELPKTPVLCKPSEAAIEYAVKIAGVNPQKTIFFDDSVRNIQAGKRVGLQTVLVGTSHKVKGADHSLESIHNIREALPELWEVSEKKDDSQYSSKVAIETPVTA